MGAAKAVSRSAVHGRAMRGWLSHRRGCKREPSIRSSEQYSLCFRWVWFAFRTRSREQHDSPLLNGVSQTLKGAAYLILRARASHGLGPLVHVPRTAQVLPSTRHHCELVFGCRFANFPPTAATQEVPEGFGGSVARPAAPKKGCRG